MSLPGAELAELLRATLAKGLPVRFRAKGFSMSPFIKDGDLITLAPLTDRSPRLGDVIAFTQKGTGKLTVHRVVRIKGDTYLIKGDNTSGAEGLESKESILGLVKSLERNDMRVSLGFGPERFVIALLSRKELLPPLIHCVWRLRHPLRKIGMISL